MNPNASSRLDWPIFILLGFLWGSSYIFIKIGVDAGLQPFTLVSLRLLIGFALLAVVVGVARESLPRNPKMSIPAVVLEGPVRLSIQPDALLAVIWLGLLGSGLAYLAFFRLLGRWGATRTSLVAYLLPI